MGPLAGQRIIEFGGIGPGPFCGMLFADMGAEVIVVERKSGDENSSGPMLAPEYLLVNRGNKSIALDLKQASGKDAALRLLKSADGLIEGFRPGVMERLGLGPDACLAANSKLVYGRVTGWGQDGPLSHAAGHELNYMALSGALFYGGRADSPPSTPPSRMARHWRRCCFTECSGKARGAPSDNATRSTVGHTFTTVMSAPTANSSLGALWSQSSKRFYSINWGSITTRISHSSLIESDGQRSKRESPRS